MKSVPKYVNALLLRRTRLSSQLRQVNSEIDNYCSKIGMDLYNTDAALCSDVRIYCETDAGYHATYNAIEEHLKKGARENERFN